MVRLYRLLIPRSQHSPLLAIQSSRLPAIIPFSKLQIPGQYHDLSGKRRIHFARMSRDESRETQYSAAPPSYHSEDPLANDRGGNPQAPRPNPQLTIPSLTFAGIQPRETPDVEAQHEKQKKRPGRVRRCLQGARSAVRPRHCWTGLALSVILLLLILIPFIEYQKHHGAE